MSQQSVDIINKVVGNFGKWQLRTILLIFLCKIPTSWFMAVIIYTAPAPPIGTYWCQPPDNLKQINSNEWINIVHPIVNNKIDYCHVYQDVVENSYKYFRYHGEKVIPTNQTIESNVTVSCKKYFFDSEFHSLIAKFDLVCSRSLLLALSQSFHIFGLLLGGILAFMLLKIMSPRHVMLTGMITQTICGNCTGLVWTYELHVTFRCLSAATCALMYTAGQNILADITGGKAKVITSIVFELFWSIGLILLPGLSIFSTDYSQLYMVISTPTIILICLHRFIPDSPRWYINRGNVEKCKQIILHGAAKNKINIPEDLDYQLHLFAADCLKAPPPAPWLALWDGNPRKRHLLCVYYAWAIYILLFNSMVLNIRAYGRTHIHINTVVMGFSEMFGVFIGMYLILYTRRRWLWTGLISISAGTIAYLTWFIPDTLKLTHIVALEMIPSIAIKIATSSSLSILTTCTADLVNVEKKKILMFSAAVWARGWFLWAPYINTTKDFGTLIPLTIFATLSVIGGILTSIINHSHHKNHKKIKHNIDMNLNNSLDNGTWLANKSDESKQ